MVEGGDAVPAGIFTCGQVGPQDAVVHHVDEGRNTVPAFVVKPDLRRPDSGTREEQ